MNKPIASLLLAITLSTGAVLADINDNKGAGGRSITAFDRLGERKIGGYFDTEFVRSDDASTFKAHRMVLELSSQVHPSILFNTEIEFEYGGKVPGTGEIKLEQAWADFEYSDNHYFRTGIVVMPFGVLNTLHDSDVRDTTNRPVYSKYIVPSTWMDTGIGGHGSFDTNNWEIIYEAYLVNGLGSAIDGSKGLRSARPGFKADNNRKPAFVGRVGASPFLGLEIGTSLYSGAYSDDGIDKVTMLGLDTQYKKGPWETIVEYASVSADGNSTPDKMNGYYVEGRYHFFPSALKNVFFAKKFDNPEFTAFLRLGQVDLDTSVTDTSDITQTTIGFNYRPIPSAAFKLEYEINDSETSVKTNKTNAIYGSVALGF